jgi:hypothetical protein
VIIEVEKSFELPEELSENKNIKSFELGETTFTSDLELLESKWSKKEIDEACKSGWEKHFGN